MIFARRALHTPATFFSLQTA